MLFCKQMEIKTVSILGCGWFGLPMAKALISNGYAVKGSTTSAEKSAELAEIGILPFRLDLNEEQALPAAFFETDLLLVNIPPRAKKERPTAYPLIMQKVANAARNVKQVIFISSTGIFEDGNFVVDENHQPQPDTESGKALLQAEQLFANSVFFTTTIIRFAGLIGPGRNLAKFFAGKADVPNGDAPINLIALQDCLGLCLQLLKTQQFGGIYHGVSPHHPDRKTFYTQLCAASQMEKPTFKAELNEWKQVDSVRVKNHLNYTFEVQNWFDWMAALPAPL
jgi:nucleoside-diphosphate-sugar epimerase